MLVLATVEQRLVARGPNAGDHGSDQPASQATAPTASSVQTGAHRQPAAGGARRPLPSSGGYCPADARYSRARWCVRRGTPGLVSYFVDELEHVGDFARTERTAAGASRSWASIWISPGTAVDRSSLGGGGSGRPAPSPWNPAVCGCVDPRPASSGSSASAAGTVNIERVAGPPRPCRSATPACGADQRAPGRKSILGRGNDPRGCPLPPAKVCAHCVEKRSTTWR